MLESKKDKSFERNANGVVFDSLAQNPLFNITLFLHNPIVGIISDSDSGFVLKANDAACRFYGYTPEEFENMRLQDINFVERDSQEQNLTSNIGENSRFFFKHKLKTGELKYVEVHSSRLAINDFNLLFTQIVDVSRQIQSEIQLSEIEGKYNALVDNSFEGVIIIDFEGSIFFINKAVTHILNLPENEIIGKKVYEFLATESIPKVLKDFETVMGGLDSFVSEYKCITGDKREIWIASIGKIASFHNQIAILISLRDITEKKLADEALRESEERFRRLLQDVQNVSIQGYAPDGTTQYWNKASEQIYGYTASEAIGKNLVDLIIPPDMHNEVKQAIKFMASTGRPIPASELMLMRKDRSLVEVFSSHTIVQVPGREQELFCIDIDLTERKRIERELLIAKEKAEESDRLKTAFIQNMSHEVRTPMNAIIGFSDLLQKNLDNKAKLTNFVQIINQRCNDLLVIINDILDVARIESGQLIVNADNFNLTDLFADLHQIFEVQQLRLKKNQIQFGLVLNPGPYDKVFTDWGKLRQIFINLIGNAFKFTDRGRIEYGCNWSENGELIFFVSDTGIGIAADKHQYIFERFSQLQAHKNKTLGGNGLGLSIVKGLVELLGGSVWLESEPGKGTTFYFTIKLQ